MPVELTFKVELESDWHINAGFGLEAQIDAVIERDSDGIPIISGSSLKGLFRDALYDLYHIATPDATRYNDSNDNDEDSFKQSEQAKILGIPGYESRWAFGHARPEGYEDLQSGQAQVGEDMAMVATGVRVQPLTRRAEENKYFVRELGQAQTFVFKVYNLDDESVESDVQWLVAAASYIRRLGGRRRRGIGRCKITLDSSDLHTNLLNNFGASTFSLGSKTPAPLPQASDDFGTPQQTTAQRFRIWIHSQRPIVVSQTAEAGNNYRGRQDVPGRTIKGAFAWMVRRSDRDSKTFQDYFVNGGAYFSTLYPVTMEGHVIAASPMGLQKVGEKDFISVVTNTTPEKGKGYTKKHILADGYPQYEGRRLTQQTHMHVAINPDTKRADEGNLYSYEAPSAGVQYVGEIYLNKGNWSEFAGLIQQNLEQVFTIRIGKARNKSYGKCQVWIEPIEDDNTPPTWMPVPLEERLQADVTQSQNRIVLTLTTDAILQDTWGRFIQKFEEKWLKGYLGDSITIVPHKDKPAFVRTQIIHGFNMQAGLPHWRDIAMIAGSTIAIIVNNPNDPNFIQKLKVLERDGIGLRRNEGFGRVIINHPAHTGIVDRFTSLTIPSELTTSDQMQYLASVTTARWKQFLGGNVIRLNTRYATPLARKLIESAHDLASANAVISAFGIVDSAEHGRHADKSSDFDNKDIRALLQTLNNDYDAKFWRKGLVLLGEHLLKWSEPRED